MGMTMILIDLKEKIRKASRFPQFSRWLVFSAALASVGVWQAHRQLVVEANRPLTIEERENVISLFEPLRIRLPQIREWQESFARDFSSGQYATTIERSLPHGDLVAVEHGRVVFTPAFFEADSMTQEQWLVQVMAQAGSHADARPQIAVRPAEDQGPVESVE